MKPIPRLVLPVMLATALAAACATHRARTVPDPSIVLICVDDMGWGDFIAPGPEQDARRGYRTPNLDRLARGGMRFTNAYAAQSVCSASRAALLTGCYPNRIGIGGALGPTDERGLAPQETTIAELYQRRGHPTALYGKWHLGRPPEHSPLRHGFDEWYGVPWSHDMCPTHPESPQAWGDLPRYEGRALPAPNAPDEHVLGWNLDPSDLTREIGARAAAFVERHAGGPFFLYVAHPLPHVPLAVSEPFRGRSAAGLYGDVLEEIDAELGRLLDALEQSGAARDTLLLFTSDNGPWLSYGEHAGASGGLREGKGTAFEGGVRVPLLAHWPARIPAASVCDEPVMLIDVLPTIAELLGTGPELPIDGRSLVPLLEGERLAAPLHEVLYFYYDGNALEALRAGRWKLHFPHRYRTLAPDTARASGGKPVKYASAEIGLALFDLEADPGETRDLSSEHPQVVHELEALAERARAELGDGLSGRKGARVREPSRTRSPDR